MKLRSDFRSVEDLLDRLREYAKQFATYNRTEWSHLKNQEDFESVYRLPPEIRGPLEGVYAHGRDLAVGMVYLLGTFDEVGTYPTFKSYVTDIEETVQSYLTEAREVIPDAEKAISNSTKHPWASKQMILLYKTEVGILESLRDEWIPRAKHSKLYKEESGKLPAVSTSESQPSSPSALTAQDYERRLDTLIGIFDNIDAWQKIEEEYGMSKRTFGKRINFVKDPFKKKVIFRDIQHAFILARCGCNKPSIVLAGGVIEELLRLYLEKNDIKSRNRDLNSYIEACNEHDLLKDGIQKLADSVRQFRNIVHVREERSPRHTISRAAAKAAVASIFTIVNDFQIGK